MCNDAKRCFSTVNTNKGQHIESAIVKLTESDNSVSSCSHVKLRSEMNSRIDDIIIYY